MLFGSGLRNRGFNPSAPIALVGPQCTLRLELFDEAERFLQNRCFGCAVAGCRCKFPKADNDIALPLHVVGVCGGRLACECKSIKVSVTGPSGITDLQFEVANGVR